MKPQLKNRPGKTFINFDVNTGPQNHAGTHTEFHEWDDHQSLISSRPLRALRENLKSRLRYRFPTFAFLLYHSCIDEYWPTNWAEPLCEGCSHLPLHPRGTRMRKIFLIRVPLTPRVYPSLCSPGHLLGKTPSTPETPPGFLTPLWVVAIPLHALYDSFMVEHPDYDDDPDCDCEQHRFMQVSRGLWNTENIN
jgi:hypothetical protein